MGYDILIRGGTVYDGSGSAGVRADVALAGGRIAAIGDLRNAGAARTIDAAGLAVAPGFIDIKTHSDFTLPINPHAHSKVRQGVTTEIVGHCGFSVAPALPDKVELLREYLSPSAPWLPFRAVSFRDYVDTFPQTSVNVGMLVGHNTLRLMAMGMDERAPNERELAHMIAMLDEALGAGALGLSTGLFTAPGSYAERAEIVALVDAARQRGGRYFTHIRDESNHVIEAVTEAIDIAGTCQVHTQIVHLKCSGVDNWGKASRILDMIAAARERGIAIDCDAYPYTAGSNPLKNLLPQWVQAGGVAAMLERLADRSIRARLRADIERDGLNNWGRIASWDAVKVSISPHLPQHAGQSFAQIAAARGQDATDALCDYLIEDRAATRVLVFSIAEDDVRTLVQSASALVGSDGNCVATEGVVAQGAPHPRFYGTFPRVLARYVREQQVLPLEQAIYKMTGGAARALGFTDRGLLREGDCADVTLFDPEDFDDRASYDDPHRYPSGARTTVIVNGVVVVENAVHTGATPGKVLRRSE